MKDGSLLYKHWLDVVQVCYGRRLNRKLRQQIKGEGIYRSKSKNSVHSPSESELLFRFEVWIMPPTFGDWEETKVDLSRCDAGL